MIIILLSLLPVVSALQATAAGSGLVIATDSSDLCTGNLKTCRTRCALPQTYVFECSSGGTFSRPKSECKCVTPPPAGVVTDGSATWKMVQWPGTEPCEGNTWLYDCAQFMNMNAMANSVTAQAMDAASAMAAAQALRAAAEAKAAQQLQQQQGGAAASAAGAAGGSATPTPAATVIPGLGAIGAASTTPSAAEPAPTIDTSTGVFNTPGTDLQNAGPSAAAAAGPAGGVAATGGPLSMPTASLKEGKPVITIERQCMPMPCGEGMGAQDAGSPFKDIGGMVGGTAGGGAGGVGGGVGGGVTPTVGSGVGGGVGGVRPAAVGTSLMGTNSLGRRRVMQFEPVSMAGVAGGVGEGSLGRRRVMQFGGSQALPLGAEPISMAGAAGGAGGVGGVGGVGEGSLAGRVPGGNSAMVAACQKPIQGLVTAANTGLMVVPEFKGPASFITRGNDTLLIQLGGSNSRCIAGYKLMAGQVLDVGRTKEAPTQQQAAKSSSAVAVPARVFMWGALVLVMQLLQHL